MMLTRTITTFNATASRIYKEDGVLKEEIFGSATFEGTNATNTQARKALSAAGVPCPRGCNIEIEEVERVTYACTLEDFMSVAHPVAKAEADGE